MDNRDGTARRLLTVAEVNQIDAQTVAELVGELHAAGLKKQTIQKTVSVGAMVFDHARIEPNPWRDKLTVKLPREEKPELQPPTAEHVEAVVRLLPSRYRLPALVLDATGMRIGEAEGLTWGDVDEPRQRWRVTGKGRKVRWYRCRICSSRPSRGLWRATIAFLNGRSSRASPVTGSEPRWLEPAPQPVCPPSHRMTYGIGASRCSTWAGCRGRRWASWWATTT